MIIIKIIKREWSWKKIICSIEGDALSWKEILNHEDIIKI